LQRRAVSGAVISLKVTADLGLGDRRKGPQAGGSAGGQVVAEDPDLGGGAFGSDVLDQCPVVVDHDRGLRDETRRRGVPDHDFPGGAVRHRRDAGFVAAAGDDVLAVLGDEMQAVHRLPHDLRPDRHRRTGIRWRLQ
jgi:hypothetical protein